MEALIVLGALVVFDLLAMRWGRDSRGSHHSREHQLASYGIVWHRDQ